MGVQAFGINLPFVMLPYFTKVVLGAACMKPAAAFSIMVAVSLIVRLTCTPIWACAGRRFGNFKVWLWYNFLIVGVFCFLFTLRKDTAQCRQTRRGILAFGVWGLIGAGNFLVKPIMADVADYDEFLSGKRREGLYMMTLEFLPKFLEVPSEVVPILLMAYLGYRRPNADGTDPGQPDEIVWLLRICFSVMPAISMFFGAVVLCSYPTEARCGKAHGRLIVAINEKHRNGVSAEDPWYPGRMLGPAPCPGPNDDVLAYFWPSEIRGAI